MNPSSRIGTPAFAAASKHAGKTDDFVAADFARNLAPLAVAYALDRLGNDGQLASQTFVIQTSAAPDDVVRRRSGERTDQRGSARRVPDPHIAQRDRLRIDALANAFEDRHTGAQ